MSGPGAVLMPEILTDEHARYLWHVKAAQGNGLLCCVCAECEDYRQAINGASAAGRSRAFVAIRHGIPLDKPWRGEALDLISQILTGNTASCPDHLKLS